MMRERAPGFDAYGRTLSEHQEYTVYLSGTMMAHSLPIGVGSWDVNMIGQTTGLSTGPVLAYILSSAA